MFVSHFHNTLAIMEFRSIKTIHTDDVETVYTLHFVHVHIICLRNVGIMQTKLNRLKTFVTKSNLLTNVLKPTELLLFLSSSLSQRGFILGHSS